MTAASIPTVAQHRFLVGPPAAGDLSAQDAFFDELAESFAQRYETHPAFRERVAVFTLEARRVLGRLGDARFFRCLDLGCGPGIIAGAVSDLGFEVIGIDRSERMIEVAQRLAARRGTAQGKTRFVQAELRDFVSSTRETFSLVISSSVLEYLTDPLEVLGLVASRLRPGGTLVVSIPNFDSILRAVEPWIQRVLPMGSRYRRIWGNELSAAEYVSAAPELGLRLETIKTFGLPKLAVPSPQRLLRNALFQTMTLLVFRRAGGVDRSSRLSLRPPRRDHPRWRRLSSASRKLASSRRSAL
jgi:2-polyprenyl-3-methyl-5-hydroxy-6-metoxy-1,4-benzoquinol methylase